MSEYNNVPKIRFKGFTDVWEQRKLGDVSFFKQGSQVDLDKQYSDLNENRVRFIRIVDYTQNTDDIRYIDKELSNNIINEKDVVIVRYGATAGFVGHGITGVLANNMFTVNPENDVAKDYLYIYLKQDKIYKKLNNSNGSSAMPALNFGTVKDVGIAYPLVAEQEKIGELFTNLDNLITLHQRKCDNLINVKKSLLEKMFPKNSSNIPEIRFKGFTDVWEQRKLEDIGDNFSTGTLGYADLSEDGKYKCVLYGDLYTKFNERIFNVKSRTNTEATKVEINDILFPTSTTVDNISLIAPSCVNQANIRVGGDLFGIRPYKNIDGNFISYCINNFSPIKYSFAKQAQGLTIVHLQYNAVKNEILMVPSIDEQKRMSQLFIEIDNLITLHQRKKNREGND